MENPGLIQIVLVFIVDISADLEWESCGTEEEQVSISEVSNWQIFYGF